MTKQSDLDFDLVFSKSIICVLDRKIIKLQLNSTSITDHLRAIEVFI